MKEIGIVPIAISRRLHQAGILIVLVASVAGTGPAGAFTGSRVQEMRVEGMGVPVVQRSGELLLACEAGGDAWRQRACESVVRHLRKRLPETSVGLASAGSDPASASVSVEWLRSHETFVMARLTWRTGSGATAQGPVLEISVNDRMIAGPDADTFGRHLADSLPAEDF